MRRYLTWKGKVDGPKGVILLDEGINLPVSSSLIAKLRKLVTSASTTDHSSSSSPSPSLTDGEMGGMQGYDNGLDSSDDEEYVAHNLSEQQLSEAGWNPWPASIPFPPLSHVSSHS